MVTRRHKKELLPDCARQLGLGSFVEALLVGTSNAVRKGESNVGLQVLLDVDPSALRCFDLLHLDDVNGAETSTVATSHLLVHLLDSLVLCQCTELLVHVGGARARIVPQPECHTWRPSRVSSRKSL